MIVAGLKKVPDTVKSAALVVFVVIVIVLLSKWTSSGRFAYNRGFVRRMKRLVQESTRLDALAQQDANSLMSLIHSTTAAAYLEAARSLTNDDVVTKAAGVNADELAYYLQEDQRTSVQRVVRDSPTLQPSGTYALSTGWV